jgi:hypothetical protein
VLGGVLDFRLRSGIKIMNDFLLENLGIFQVGIFVNESVIDRLVLDDFR